MRGMKIPPQDFALKMQGGLMREVGRICGTLRYINLWLTSNTYVGVVPRVTRLVTSLPIPFFIQPTSIIHGGTEGNRQDASPGLADSEYFSLVWLCMFAPSFSRQTAHARASAVFDEPQPSFGFFELSSTICRCISCSLCSSRKNSCTQ